MGWAATPPARWPAGWSISTLVSLALDIPDWFFRVDAEHAPEIERRARRAVQQVASKVVARGQQNEALRGMGSTLTAARSYGDDLLIVHVGDSRAYLFRAGRLHRLTKDHTYAQLLVDTGQLSASEVAGSRMRHVLTNVLGGSDDEVQVDIDLLRLEDGDRLLLCSDGLTDLVNDDDDRGHAVGSPAIVTGLLAAGPARARRWRPRQHHGDRGGIRHSQATGASGGELTEDASGFSC